MGQGIDYPPEGNYPHNKVCRWTIRREKSYLLKFHRFNLEHDSDCDYDYVRIDTGTKMCGSVFPSDVYLRGNSSVTVTFRSDSSQSGRGFKAEIIGTCLFSLFSCTAIPLYS